MVHIITDTTSGLPQDLADRYDIPVVPQVIHFGTKSYLECVEMDSKAFVERLVTSDVLPQTSAPPPELYHPCFAYPVRVVVRRIQLTAPIDGSNIDDIPRGFRGGSDTQVGKKRFDHEENRFHIEIQHRIPNLLGDIFNRSPPVTYACIIDEDIQGLLL